jgi:hypothetical protein
MSGKAYNQCRILVQNISVFATLKVYYLEIFNYDILDGILDYIKLN